MCHNVRDLRILTAPTGPKKLSHVPVVGTGSPISALIRAISPCPSDVWISSSATELSCLDTGPAELVQSGADILAWAWAHFHTCGPARLCWGYLTLVAITRPDPDPDPLWSLVLCTSKNSWIWYWDLCKMKCSALDLCAVMGTSGFRLEGNMSMQESSRVIWLMKDSLSVMVYIFY